MAIKQKICLLYLLVSISLYGQNFYNKNSIQKIELQFPFANWDYRLDTAKLGSENYLPASWVKINGVKIDSVGVKYKGNSSYDSTRSKNSLHIELDAYINQTYQGYVDIKLNNCYQDPSMIREVMSYDLLSNYMKCPKANFAQVYINGTYAGVYTNVESINKTFCANNFYSNNNTFIKCNPIVVATINTKSNLLKLTGDSSAYSNFYEIKSDYGWKELEKLCDSVTNFPNNIETYMDVDRAIWMLAYNTTFINLDSYSGAFCQNYYIYKDNNKRYNPIIWDLNMNMGGFPFLGVSNTSQAGLTIANMQQLPINIHSTDNYWPLIKAIYNNAKYKRMYVAHMKTMLTEQIQSGNYITNYNTFKNTIDTAVFSDTKKLFSYSQFTTSLNNNHSVGSYSVPGIQILMDARKNYLLATTDFTVQAPSISSITNNSIAVLNNNIVFTASVTTANLVEFCYRSDVTKKFTKATMFDDGLHNDGASGDNIYGVSFPLNAYNLQYYIYAENTNAALFSPQRAEHEFHQYNVYPIATGTNVVINEILSHNTNNLQNEFNSYEDWIELYNTSNSNITVSNLFISDASKNKFKYKLPGNLIIPPNAFLTLWADESTQTGNQLHANFKLNKDNDQLYLSNYNNQILDSVSFKNQIADISLGRCGDGVGAFIQLASTSFSASNCFVGIKEYNKNNLFNVYPNPTTGKLTVITKDKSPVTIINAMGQTVFKFIPQNLEENIINLNYLTDGIYIMTQNNFSQKIIIQH